MMSRSCFGLWMNADLLRMCGWANCRWELHCTICTPTLSSTAVCNHTGRIITTTYTSYICTLMDHQWINNICWCKCLQLADFMTWLQVQVMRWAKGWVTVCHGGKNGSRRLSIKDGQKAMIDGWEAGKETKRTTCLSNVFVSRSTL